MSEAETEAAILAAGKTLPRITPADLDRVVVGEYYTTAAAAFPHAPVIDSMQTFTICVLVLRNGFIVTGESAAASPRNYDEAIGHKIARENARAKLWPLLGYQLRDHLWMAAEATRQAEEALKAAVALEDSGRTEGGE